MTSGGYISAAGHIGLVGWLLFGGGFSSDPLPVEVTEVSMISVQEFEALIAGEPPAPVLEEAPAQPVSAPEPAPQPAPVPAIDSAPEPAPAPTPAPAPVPDVQPEVLPEPLPQTEVTPEAPAQPEPVVIPDPEPAPVTLSVRPKPRPAPRVAPEPVAAPEPDVTIAEEAQEAIQEGESGQAEAEPQEATAQEETATEIVTEAEALDQLAPRGSTRPKARPNRPAPQEVEPETQTASAEPTSEDAPQTDTAAAIAAALEAVAAENAQASAQLSDGETQALRLQMRECWRVGHLSTEALNTTITVAFEMTEAGRPVNASIRLIGREGGSEESAFQAFVAARQAINECGARGFDLPPEKFDQWRAIEMTFNPERMRLK